jgi:ABC-type transport system involved in multi-copper enzyme maturation permease subunit
MFGTLVAHEIRHRLRTLSTHVYFLIFFALSFLMMNAMGGAFSDANIALLGSGPNTNLNGPFVINALTWLLSLLGMLITAPFMGQAIYRDYDSGIHPLMFTTPVSKFEYLGGRFVGSLVVHLYLYAGLTGGLMLGTVVPWVEASRFGAFSLAAYLQPYLIYLLPNLIIVGSFFFALPALTRKMLPNYIGGVVLFMGYNIAQLLLGADALQNSTVASLVDPFGFIPVREITRYWTVAEQNALLVPFEGMVLANRALWLVFGVAVLGLLYRQFEFAHLTSGTQRSGDDEGSTRSLADVSPTSIIHAVTIPRVQLVETAQARWSQFWAMTKRAFLEVVRDVYFYAIVGASLIFLVVSADQAGTSYGTPVQPVTYQILDGLSGQFAIFMIVLIAFYAGQLVWRERDLRMQQLHDSLPLPSHLSLAAKGAALGLVSAVLMLVVFATGIGTQLAYGFTDIDVGLYLVDLYAVEWVDYLLLGALALTIHVVVNHKYLGHFIMVAFFLLLGFSSQIGLEHNLYWFNADPGMPYSDMNEYGHFAIAFFWHKLLWGAVAILMAVLSRLLWVRGEDTAWSVRLTQARRRLSPTLLGTTGIAGVLALGTGAFIYVNTTVWNTYRTSDEQQTLAAEYEKTYEPNADLPQPRIAAVDLNVDLFPEERDARLAGRYTLVNDHERAVDSLHVELPAEADVQTLAFSRDTETIRVDGTYGVRILRLPTPLAPGDSMTLDFDLSVANRGFTNSGGSTSIVYNGTFANSGLLPHFGYDENRELSDRSQRTDYGLDEEPRMQPRSDSTARMRPYVARDATWLNYEATVSTSTDQIALAPGTRDSTWTENGRRYARFRTTAPTLGFFSFLSAEYTVKRDTWTPPDSTTNNGESVGVEVYYHPEHDYNVDRMVEAVRHSLRYYTTHFGPYQSEQVRIAEFPRYASFAQSFLGTIPYSESIGFIARVDPETDIDYPYYITAHEMAHQWWAHQVVSGPVWGATMLVETLSQYSALMVMEEAYGRDKMKRFLEYELDQYLSGRAQEQRAERPLIDVAAQQGYIHYRKGSLAMYALKDYLGEDTVNRVLRDFLAEHKFETPPFTTSEALIERFEAAAPDSLKGFVGDLFREITLYENRAVDATYTETDAGRYEVTLTVSATKRQADSLGTETEVPMNDPVAIGVFGTDAEVGDPEQETLYLQKHTLTSGEQTITVTVDEEPARAGVDPFVTLVDRNTDDNVTDVTRAKEDG